jgi:hypothetical protein
MSIQVRDWYRTFPEMLAYGYAWYMTQDIICQVCLAYARHMILVGHMQGICKVFAMCMPEIYMAYELIMQYCHMSGICQVYNMVLPGTSHQQ